MAPMRSFDKRFLACLALAACTPNNGGNGVGQDSDDSTSGTSTGTTPGTLDTTAEGTTAGSGDASSSGGSSSGGSSSSGADSSSTGPGCTLGEEACGCDEGACNDGLVCLEDVCVVLLCGNGDVDVGEECDDANGQDSDGCDNDCTISSGAAQVIAGDEHVCALFHTGDIKCWGAFESGRLGYMGQNEEVGDDETPADMPFVNTGAAVVQLALGTDFTCALLDTDEVKCWGSGQDGRLGQGTGEGDLGIDEEPADIPAIDFGGETPVQIAAGGAHACAVMQSGELNCWGRNDMGQLGLGNTQSVGIDDVPGDLPGVDLGPGVVAEQVAAGANHTCVLLSGGGVLCFGTDTAGQLGTPAAAETVGDDELPSASTPVLLPELAVLIAARYNHTCVSYDTGTLQCWGDGGAGRLGYGNSDNVGDNEDVVMLPPVDPDGSDPTSFGMGSAHTCVRLGTTQIYCWGEAQRGQLGYGDVVDLFAPSMNQVNLALPLAPRMVTAGREFSCATTEGSQVKCWGRNNRGQLGYGLAFTTDLADNEPIDTVGPVEIE